MERNNREGSSRAESLEIASRNNTKEELRPLDYHSKFTEIMKIPPQF